VKPRGERSVPETDFVDCLTRDELNTARSVVERYLDLRLGLADASLVVLAARYSTSRIVTFDERVFRAVAPLQGGAFTVLPADIGMSASHR
jgi:predicted nucleic acid-binding protein